MATLPPLTMKLSLPREKYLALRAEAFRSGRSMQAIVRGWIDAELASLPPAEDFRGARDDDGD